MTARVGLIGYGRWGANVQRDLLTLGVVVSVAEPDAARRNAAVEAGADHAVAAPSQLPECDGYVVVTPASSHREVCTQLLARGAPVFVEKPPCGDLADVEALARIADGRLFVMHKWRYHPGIRALGELARAGTLGTPQQLETIRTGPELLPPDVDVLWHLGPHDLSIAVEILGGIGSVQHAHCARDVAGRITQCRAAMTTATGLEHRMTLAVDVPDRVRKVVLSGTEGSAVLENPDAPAISLHTDRGVTEIEIPPTMPLAEELRLFLAYLEGGPPPVSDMTTALDVARRLVEMRRVGDEGAA